MLADVESVGHHRDARMGAAPPVPVVPVPMPDASQGAVPERGDEDRAATQGDAWRAAGFEAFARAHWDRAVRLAMSTCNDWSDAQDIVSDSMTNMWRRWDLVPIHNPWAFLARSVRNGVVDRSRAKAREGAALVRHGLPPAVYEDAVVEDRDQLMRLLASLSASHQHAIALRYLLDLGEDEVAKLYDVPIATAKSRTWRALVRLRNAFDVDSAPPVASTAVPRRSDVVTLS